MANTSAPYVPKGFDSFGRWFEMPFKLFGANAGVWLLQGLIALGLSLVVSAIAFGMALLLIPGFSLAALSSGPNATHTLEQAAPGILAAMIAIILVIVLISGLGYAYIGAGMTYTALKQLRGEQISAGDIFKAGYATPAYFGASILAGLAIMVSFLFCCFPALFVAPLFVFVAPAVVDRRCGSTDSISLSSETVKQNYWLFFVFCLVVILLIWLAQVVLSFIPFLSIVTVVVVLPFEILFMTVPYVDCFYGSSMQTGGARPSGPQPYLPPAYNPTQDQNPQPPRDDQQP